MISAHDRDFPVVLKIIYFISTEFVFDLEPQFLKTVRVYSKELVNSIEEKYEDFIEEFIDDIFECESLVSREHFIEALNERHTYLVDP